MPTVFNKSGRASEVARLIIDSRSIAWAGDEQSFTFTSGWKSPVYVNMRGVLGLPEFRTPLIEAAADFLASEANLNAVDVIAGGETAGIPYAAMLADRLGKKFAYVRKAQKGFGMGRLIEGADLAGQRALLVEDLTTDGKSKIAFVNTMRDAGAVVDEIFSCFYYGLRDATAAIFEPAGLSLGYLCEWSDVLAEDRVGELLTSDQQQSLRQFLVNPAQWAGPLTAGA